jgi:uncharacterized protein
MLIKYLLLLVVGYIIYLVFFKKKAIQEEQKSKKENKKETSDIMVECSECSTFVSQKEAIIKDGKFYCSKKCAKLK